MIDSTERVHFKRFGEETPDYADGFFSAILENSHEGIYVTDGNATTVLANRSYELISGLEREKLIGRNMRDLVSEGVISISGSLHALETGKPFTSEQVFSTGKRAFITSTPIFSEDGKIVMIVTNVMDITELHAARRELRKKEAQNRKYHREMALLRHSFDLGADIITVDANMLEAIRIANRVALVDAPVSIQGGMGTGKETLARYIHTHSPRSDKPFVRITVSSVPEQSIGVALFGFGEHSGHGYRKGLLESADGGTVYIDEVFDLPLEVQNRLLMLIKNGILSPINGTPHRANIRVLAGSRRSFSDFEQMQEVNRDLFYELGTFTVRIPSLCDRRDDIIPLLDNFLAEFNKKYHMNKHFDSLVYSRLLIYPWPGNIRELKNLVQRAVIISTGDVIDMRDIITEGEGALEADASSILPDEIDLKFEVEKLESEYMTLAFRKHKNTRGAAKNLGMDSSTFVRKRQAYAEKGLMQKCIK